MKLHLPLGLLVAVLAAFQTEADDPKEFNLSYTIKDSDWEPISEELAEDFGNYHVDLPFTIYSQSDWTFEWKYYKRRSEYFISSLPRNMMATIQESTAAAFYVDIASILTARGLSLNASSSTGDVSDSTRFELKMESSGGRITSELEGLKSASETVCSFAAQGIEIPDAPDVLFSELYASGKEANITVSTSLELEQSNEYVVARAGTLGSYKRGTGLLGVWDDLRHPLNMLILNTDYGKDVDSLFHDPANKDNVLRFTAPKSKTEQAVGEPNLTFENITVQEGGGVVRTENFYAKGVRVDEGAVDYVLEVNGDVGFGSGAEFTFEENFTVTGTGTVTWDGNATFDIAEGKVVHWNLSGSKDPETGEVTVGGGHVIIGTKDWQDEYAAGGVLSVGGDYALGMGSIDVYGSTLDMGGTVWGNEVTLYSAGDTGSYLAGVGNAAEGTAVRVRALLPTPPSEVPGAEGGTGGTGGTGGEEQVVTSVDFGLGGLKGEYLKSVDLGNRGGRVYGIGGGTVTVERDEAFNFLVKEENITYAKRDEAPAGGTYLMEFSESGTIEFKEGAKINLTLSDAVVEWLYELEGGDEDEFVGEEDGEVGEGSGESRESGGYVDLWLTNGSFTELKNLQETGAVGGMKSWFQSRFTLEAGVEIEDVDVIVENDFVNGTEGGGGILRFVLRANGIWFAGTHGDADAREISDERWQQVRVNEDMTVTYSKRDDGKITVRNLNSGTDGSKGNLTVFNKINDEDVTLIIDQWDADAVGGRSLRGSIILNQGEAVNRINLTKMGTEELHVTGNIEKVGTLKVEKGQLTVEGNLVNAGTLVLAEKDGEDVTAKKLILNGTANEAERLGAIDQGSELQVNGMLKLKGGSSSPTGQGKIGGKGVIVASGALNASGVVLAGVGVELNGENAMLVTSSQSTVESATGEAGTNKVSALFGAEGTGGSVSLGGDLIIDSTGSNLAGMSALYCGSVTSSDGNARALTVSGASTDQTLRNSGDGAISVTVDGGARMGLIGEKPGTAVAAQEGETPAPAVTYSEMTYANVTVNEGSTLALMAPSAGKGGLVGTKLHTTGDFTVKNGARVEVYYNLTPTKGDVMGQVGTAVVSDATMAWDAGAKLVLGSMGVNPFDLENPQDLVNLKVLSNKQGITGLDNGQKVDCELRGSFLVFWEKVQVMYDGGDIMVSAKARKGNVLSSSATKSENVQAGARLLWEARTSNAMNDATTELSKVMNQVVYELGNTAAVSKTFAGVAGSTIPAVGTAQRDALRAQMLRMRDHAGAMGLDNESTYESLPYSRFWMEASGVFSNLNDDSMMSGYKYNSWGGTVGLEMDLSERTSLGLGLSALYGDLDGGTCDKLDGNMDSYYLSFMARFTRQRWGHTVLATVGLNSADIDRTVQYGAGSYTTSGSTDGWGAGLMYELTYDIPLDEEHTQVLQPLLGVSVMRTTLDGYNEGGVGAQGVGLNVGEQEWVTSTFMLGLRWVNSIGASVFNTAAQLELRANIAQDVGDSQGSADVALQANPRAKQSVKAAEAGKTAAQLGAALRMPISEEAQIYFNVGADLRSGMDAWNATVGLKYSF